MQLANATSPNQLPGRKGKRGNTGRDSKLDGKGTLGKGGDSSKGGKGDLKPGGLKRPQAESSFLVVNTGVSTGATVKGFGKLLPEEQRNLLGSAFLIGALSIIGLPPLGGSWSK